MSDKYKCPTCDSTVDWTSNDAMIGKGWVWVSLNGEARIICKECADELKADAKDLMDIGSARQGRYGSIINKRTEGS